MNTEHHAAALQEALDRFVKIATQMTSPWVGRSAVAALVGKSLTRVDQFAATGVWGKPKMVAGSPMWSRERVLESLENGELAGLPTTKGRKAQP